MLEALFLLPVLAGLGGVREKRRRGDKGEERKKRGSGGRDRRREEEKFLISNFWLH